MIIKCVKNLLLVVFAIFLLASHMVPSSSVIGCHLDKIW